MTDKILTEAFDRLKAIEESDDPFCIGEGNEDYKDGEEFDDEHETVDSAEQAGRYADDSAESRRKTESYSASVQTPEGDEYLIDFQTDANGTVRAFLDINGITVATYTDTPAGAQQAQIKDDGQVLDAIAALILQFGEQ